jgi:hypothetical protein
VVGGGVGSSSKRIEHGFSDEKSSLSGSRFWGSGSKRFFGSKNLLDGVVGELKVDGKSIRPGHQRGSRWRVAALAVAGGGSEVAMSGSGMCEPGAIGSREGRDVVAWFGSSGESGVVMGRPCSSCEMSHCGGGDRGRWNSANASLRGITRSCCWRDGLEGGGGGHTVAVGVEEGGCGGVSNAAGRGGCSTLFQTR